MNKKIIIKVLVDIMMCILFTLELNLNITGLTFHEIIGLLAGLMIIIHLSLNHLWIKSIFKNNNKNRKLKLMVLLNFTLLLTTLTMLVTGIIISKSLFNFNVNNLMLNKVHKIVSYATGILILIHIFVHLSYLKNTILKIFKSKEISLWKKILLLVFIIIFSSLGIYTIVNNLFYKESKVVENNKYKEEKEEETEEKEEIKTQPEEIINDEIKQPEPEPKPTLEEYLSKLYCDGCGRRCSLLAPRCSTGRYNAEKAKNDYDEIYQ